MKGLETCYSKPPRCPRWNRSWSSPWCPHPAVIIAFTTQVNFFPFSFNKFSSPPFTVWSSHIRFFIHPPTFLQGLSSKLSMSNSTAAVDCPFTVIDPMASKSWLEKGVDLHQRRWNLTSTANVPCFFDLFTPPSLWLCLIWTQVFRIGLKYSTIKLQELDYSSYERKKLWSWGLWLLKLVIAEEK